MSQSSNSTSNLNIFSGSSTITSDNKANSPIVERGIKRVASDELGSEVKKITVDHHSHQKQAPSIVSPSLDQPKFMSATMMMNSSARANVQIMPELSDEELLAYAVEFEKNNP